MDQKLKSSEIGAELGARTGRDPKKEQWRFQEFVKAGIIPPDGEARARGGRAWLFPRSAPAVATVLYWLFDNAGVRDRSNLRACWNFLAVPHHSDGEPAITHVMAEIAAGRTAWLIVTQWGDRQSGETTFGLALRFEEDKDRPLDPPVPGFEPMADLTLDLGHALQRFVFEPPPKSEVN